MRQRLLHFKRNQIIFFALVVFALLKVDIALGQISQRGSVTSATTSGKTLKINKPTGVVAGDVMIVNICKTGNVTTTPTSSGWTLIAGANHGGSPNIRYGAILYRISDGTEGSSFTFNLGNGVTDAVGSIIAFSGVSGVPFDVTPGSINTGLSYNATASAITTITANSAILFLGQSLDTSWSSWSGTNPTFTEIMDVSSTNVSVAAAWGIYTGTGTTGDRTATLNVTNEVYFGAILIALRPVPTITSLGSASGCEGTSITINGTNLSGATASSVRIGGTPVTSITSQSATQIIAVIGPGTTGRVTVVTPDGTATSTSNFTVSSSPSIFNVTGGGSYCSGGSGALISLSGSETGVNYQLYRGTSAIGTSVAGTGSSISFGYQTAEGTYTVSAIRSNGGCTANMSGNATISVNTLPSPPTATGAQICIGTTAVLSALGASSGQYYKWYDASSGGNLLKTSTNNADNTYATPILSSTTNYWVSIVSSSGCESNRTQVTAIFPSVSGDDKEKVGTDFWIGHVFKRLDGAATAPNDANAFTNYYGVIAEPLETFDELFNGNTTCLDLTATESSRSIYTEYFAVRFRMRSTRAAGIYLADIGSDDGTRLTVDGSLVYDRWIQRSYTTDVQVLFPLSGSSNLLLEYYESTGGNRVSFQNLMKIPNTIISGASQTICEGNAMGQIAANNAFTDSPISENSNLAVTYLWQQANKSTGPWTDIVSATGQNYTPTVTVPGTYFFRRKLTVSRTNAGISTATSVSDYSGIASLTITPATVITAQSINGQVQCLNGSFSPISVSAGGTGTLTYQWYSNLNAVNSGGSAISGATFASYTPLVTSVGTQYYYCVVSGNCGTTTSTASGAFAVTPLPSAPSAANQSKTYTGIANTTIISATTGSGETIDWYDSSSGGTLLISGSATYTPTAVNAATYTYYAEARNSSTGCLSSSRTAVTLTINKAILTVTANPQTVAYSTAVSTVTGAGTSTITGYVNSENSSVINGTISYSTTYTASTAAGTSGVTIIPVVTGLSASNYTFSAVNGTITVSKTTLLITADNKTKVYDGAIYSGFTVGYSGFVNGETSLVLGGTLSFTGTATTAKNVGSAYVITPGGLTSANYNISFVSGSLNITKATLVPNIIANNKCFDGNSSATLISKKLSGVISPDVVALEVGSVNFSSAAVGTAKTVTASGLYLSGSDAGNYSLATTIATTSANINALPVPAFTAASGTSECAGDNVIYTTQPDQTNYVWTVSGLQNTDYIITSGGLGSTSNSVTLKWVTAGSKTVTVNYTDGSGCTGTAAQITTEVHPVPEIGNFN